jgi:hypothetical protein
MQELGIYGQFKGANRVLGSGLLAPSGTRLRGSERHKSRLERNILYAVYGSGNRKNFVYSKASSRRQECLPFDQLAAFLGVIGC